MAISEDHSHDIPQLSHSAKTLQPDELIEQDETVPNFTNLEKQQQNALAEGVASFQPVEGVDYNVTFKTWLVVALLAIPNGFSFWPVSCFAVIQSEVAAELGDATKAVWFTAVYPMAATVAFMVCGVNSDLFGRRYFIVFGNLLVTLGSIVCGSAQSTSAFIVGMAITGFGGGNCQLAAFALPELLPNKYRPAAIVLAETTNYINLIVGPAASRYALEHSAWRWLLYSMSIVIGLSGVGTALLYFPPKHPRGIPWRRAVQELDYIGAITFTSAAVLILSGINYASYLPSSDPKVIVMLVVGFAMLVTFASWETFMPLKQPLTPTRIFTRNKGRTFTAPFIAGLMVSMFYLGIAVVWNTMIAVFFTTSTSGPNKAIELSLAQGFGILTGAILLGTVGQKVGHYKWQMFGALTGTTLFGGLLALGEPSRQGLSIAFVFLGSLGYGWGQYLSIVYIQFGADQIELGIAGGLAGVARYAGGAISQTVYATILTNVVTSNAIKKVLSAAVAAGASLTTAEQVLAALPSGSAALMKVPGISIAIAEAAGAAFVDSYIVGIRTVALVSIAFGGTGMIACLFMEEITPKMTKKIEVFLENDVNADMNKYH